MQTYVQCNQKAFISVKTKQKHTTITTMLTLKRTHLHKTHFKQIHSLAFRWRKAVQRLNASK